MFYIPGATKVLPLRPGDMFFIPSAAAESSSSKESNRPGRDVLNLFGFARNENERNRKRERERDIGIIKNNVLSEYLKLQKQKMFSLLFFSQISPLYFFLPPYRQYIRQYISSFNSIQTNCTISNCLSRQW